MRSSCPQRKVPYSVEALALGIFAAVLLKGEDPGVRPDELVAKHLASIGAPEAIAAARSRVISGNAEVTFRLPRPGHFNGSGTVLSDGRRLGIRMIFSSVEYPWEELTYDGRKVTVSQVRPGERSPLSEFVYQWDVLLKEGLLGGTMTTAWALLDVPGRKPRLEYGGIRNFEGKRSHELRYWAKTGPTDLHVSLYFEQETFRHLHTRIWLTQLAGMAAGANLSSEKRETLYTLVESYSDFRAVDSLTLPHRYKLVQMIDAQNTAVLLEYGITAASVVHNQTFDPKLFTVP